MITFNFLRIAAYAGLVLGTLACSNAQTTSGARAVAFKAAPAAVMSEAQIAALCAKLATPCDAKNTKAWVGEAPPLGKLFLIDNTRPMLMLVNDGRIARQWDFAQYIHSRPAARTEPREPLEIYPALYPAGNGQYAIAIEHQQREGYSGGGAMFSVADFVLLDNTPRAAGDPPKLMYAGVPFSCSKMIRACFSEREYQTSRHCHDEVEGYLTIQFPPRNATPSGWSFTWHETTWPAHVTKAHARRTQTRFTLPPASTPGGYTLPKAVPFCGGPQ